MRSVLPYFSINSVKPYHALKAPCVLFRVGLSYKILGKEVMK